MQAFAPVLAANDGGAFINVLSVASWVGMPSLASYSASKAAAWGWTNAAASSQVRAAVGFVDTDLTAALDIDKIAPQAVATSALDALERGDDEAIVDAFSRAIKSALHDDHNLLYAGIAEQFNATVAR